MSALENIDYGLLAQQRKHIIDIIGDFAEWQTEGSREDQIEALEGVLNLLDAITDAAIAEGVTTEDEALIKSEEGVVDGAGTNLMERNGLL